MQNTIIIKNDHTTLLYLANYLEKVEVLISMRAMELRIYQVCLSSIYFGCKTFLVQNVTPRSLTFSLFTFYNFFINYMKLPWNFSNTACNLQVSFVNWIIWAGKIRYYAQISHTLLYGKCWNKFWEDGSCRISLHNGIWKVLKQVLRVWFMQNFT